MQRYRLAKYKSNFEIDFLFVVYLSKRQNIKKKSELTATSLDLLRCSRGTKVQTSAAF